MGYVGQPDLSVCIVNWNTRDLLRACLRSLAANAGERAREVIVVDNASMDGSAEMVAAEFPQVTLLANRENTGYAAGNNQALRAAQGRYLMVLNPDTEAPVGTFERMLSYLEAHPQVGMVAPRLVYPDGSPQASCLAFPTLFTEFAELTGMARRHPASPFWARYTMAGWAHDDTREVDQPMGSCLLLRREVVEQVGLLDERFPLYYNDVDWCWRIKRAGWRIVFLAEAPLVHHRRAASDKLGARRLVEHHRGKSLYFRKRLGWWGYPGYWLLNVTFLGAAWLRRVLRERARRLLGRPPREDAQAAQLAAILRVYLSPGHLRPCWQPPEG